MSDRKPTIHDSISRGRTKHGKDRPYARSFALPKGVLKLGSAIAAGDYVRQEIIKREEFNAQHGTVKVLWKNGKPVEQEASK